MTGKNLARRIHAMTASIALASLLWACAGADRHMTDMQPSMEPYADLSNQSAEAVTETAQTAATATPEFGSVVQSISDGIYPVTDVSVAFDDDTYESVVTITRLNPFTGTFSSELVFDTGLNSLGGTDLEASETPLGRDGKDEFVVSGKNTEFALARVITVWSPNVFGDWASGGYWLYIDTDPETGEVSSAEVGAFIDGPEFSGESSPPTIGQATYEGLASGLYTAEVGSDGAFEEGTYALGEYRSSLALTADFTAGTIHGSVDNIVVSGSAYTPSGDEIGFANEPLGGEIVLESAGLSANGRATGSASVSGNNVASSEGVWGVQLSSMPDGFENPRAVGGTSGAIYTTTGGSEIALVGALYGVPRPPE